MSVCTQLQRMQGKQEINARGRGVNTLKQQRNSEREAVRGITQKNDFLFQINKIYLC